jgi:anti-sigma factor RsiW
MSGMTCREFDEVVHGFVRMELLDVSLREAVIEHAAHCDNCAERMGEAGLLAEVTEAAAGSVRDQQAPPNVEAALLSSFRNQRRRRYTTLWRTFEWAAAGAAAAMLAAILWTSSTHSKVQPSPSPRKDVSSQSKEPLDASALGLSQSGEAAQETELEASNGDTGETYSVSDFVPVPFTDGIGPEDPGMVVRVQLTRASLAELGYPVAEAPDEDLIRADVLVDQDGWPRGVRLVQ